MRSVLATCGVLFIVIDPENLQAASLWGGASLIKELIHAGDKWETQKDIAQVYMHNMGAFYGTKENWSQFQEGMLARGTRG